MPGRLYELLTGHPAEEARQEGEEKETPSQEESETA